MSKKSRKKGYLAGVMALLIAVAGVTLPKLYAAGVIDPTASCSLTIEVGDTASFAEDLKTTSIAVDLYRVAELAQSGAFTSTTDFQSLQIENLQPGQEDWPTMAETAAGLAANLTPTTSFTVENGTGTVSGLQTGMYLVVVHPTDSQLYTYTFTPYLISLPDNLYYQTGLAADDNWIYDATAGLKPEQEPRTGDLQIIKSVTEFAEILGEVTFVYDIVGVNAAGEVVYSNVAATMHSAAGTETVTVTGIPAGTVVTVTEASSGASYTLISAPSVTTTIAADALVGVEFTNTYDDRLIPTYGAVNQFVYDENEGWVWTRVGGGTAPVNPTDENPTEE